VPCRWMKPCRWWCQHVGDGGVVIVDDFAQWQHRIGCLESNLLSSVNRCVQSGVRFTSSLEVKVNL
jgi:hypothetical protein